ncbi:MAG: hypothetical protein KatS3mg110_0936 [Pirellulaceae bacterium]|nr:MAG: hypothetical protein KatS3mg110_0936 [Pirellulaceae bacterium]
MPWKKLKELADGRTYSQFIKALVEAQAANPNNVWEDGRSKADYWQHRVRPEELVGLAPEEKDLVRARAKQAITQDAAQFAMIATGTYSLGMGIATTVMLNAGKITPHPIAKGVLIGGSIAIDSYFKYQFGKAWVQIVGARDAAIRDYVDMVGQ